MHLLAQIENPIGKIFKGIGPLGDPDLVIGCNSVHKLASVLSSVIGLITVLSFLWFTFQVIISAIQWIASGGEKAALQNAQQRLTHSVIGLAISVAGIFIVILISNILGIGNVLFLPGIINNLLPPGAAPPC